MVIISVTLKYHRYNHFSSIDENYLVITLIHKKYGDLPLCLENYALLSLPPIFTIVFNTYPLRYIIYLGEPSGKIISNCHGTLIQIYMHWYDVMFKRYIWNSYFPRLTMPFFCPSIFSCQKYIKTLSFFTNWIFISVDISKVYVM